MDAWLLRVVKRGLWYCHLSYDEGTRDEDLQCIKFSACLSSGNEVNGRLGSIIYITRGLVITAFNPLFQQKVDEQAKFTIALKHFLLQGHSEKKID